MRKFQDVSPPRPLPAETGEPAGPSRSGEQPLVMVVNDDPTQLRLLCALLKDEAYSLLPCTAVEEALSFLRRKIRPSLIVTDLYMPQMDGWRFCRLLRSPAFQEFNQLPILVVSATYSGTDASSITLELGANAFLSSPVDRAQYLATVRSLLSGRVVRQQLKVLVVDDSPSLCGLLDAHFTANGCDTRVAHSGQEARETAAGFQPDLFVLDYHLPDDQGDRLLGEFRNSHPAASFIMISTDPNPELALQWMKAGAHALVRKPFRPEFLFAECQRVLREKSLLRVEEILEERTRNLRQSESLHRFLISHVGDLIIFHDRLGIVFTANAMACDCLGTTEEEIRGKSLFDLGQVESRTQLQADMDRVWGEGEFRFNAEFLCAPGEPRVFEFCSRRVEYESRDFILSIARDITDRKRQSEERIKLMLQLQQADKMATLGTLVAGVAHEINNPNNFIMLNSDILAHAWRDMKPVLDRYVAEHGELHLAGLPYDLIDERLSGILNGLQEGSRRIQEIVADLKDYAGADRSGMDGVVDIGQVVRAALHLTHNMIQKSTVRLRVGLGDNLPAVRGSAQKLEQVVINLLQNSCNALTEPSQEIRVHTRFDPRDGLVRIVVADEGHGIAAGDLPRITDPFFTTRREQGGTGLGLSVSRRIVEDHGGTLVFESQPGRGTTVTVNLPVAAANR